jgi:hypothetical protein
MRVGTSMPNLPTRPVANRLLLAPAATHFKRFPVQRRTVIPPSLPPWPFARPKPTVRSMVVEDDDSLTARQKGKIKGKMRFATSSLTSNRPNITQYLYLSLTTNL